MPFPLLFQKATRVILLLFCAWAAFFFFLSVETKAQSLSSHSDFVMDQWGTVDGLPVNNVIKLLQSEVGYLWMATYDGLVRFDGVNFKVYQTENTPGLPSNRLTNLKEAPDGSLWIETEQYLLVRFSEGEFHHIEKEDGLNGNFCESIEVGPDGKLWFASEEGISVYDGNNLHPYEPEIIKGNIGRIFVEQSGAVWYLDKDKFKIYRFQDGSSKLILETDGNYLPFMEDETGTIWFGSELEVYSFEQGKLNQFSSVEAKTSGPVGIGQDKEGNIWVSTYNNGFYKLTEGKAAHYSPSEGESFSFLLPFFIDEQQRFWKFSRNGVWRQDEKILNVENAINSYIFDREGSLWIGTNSDGVIRLKANPFKTFSMSEGLLERNVYPVLEDQNGAIWAGTHGRGVAKIADGRVETDYQFEGIGETNYTLSLAQTTDGTILAGLNSANLYERKPGSSQFTIVREPGAPHTETIFAIYEQHEGKLWVGAQTKLYLKKDDEWQYYNQNNGFTNHQVRYFLKAPGEDTFWMATNGAGIARYKAGEFTFFGIDEGLGSNLIRSLHIELVSGEQDYVLWVGTEDRGLIRLKVEQGAPQLQDKTIYGTNTGMLDYVIHVILKDDDDNFWFNTNRGIFTVPHKELEAFHRGEITSVKGTSYTENDGLRNREGNGGMQPAGIKASDGRLWLPSQDGLVVLNPPEIKNNNLLPPVVIGSLQTFDDERPLASGKEIKLSASQRDFEFSYTALSLVASEKNAFRYRLAGYNDTWIDAGSRRTATYTNIPAGSYTFEVQGSNNTGNWNPEAATVTLNVAPFFYETTAFRLSILFVILLLSYGGMRWRVRVLEQNKARLEKLVDERTWQLSREKQKTEEQAERLKELDKAKTRFFTNISHEFRTPLTLIISPLQRLLSSGISEFKPATQNVFKRMLRNSDRLLRLIDQTLELTRLEHGKLKLHVGEIELNDFLHGFLELFEPICDEKDIQFQFLSGDGECLIFADPGKLDKMVANLISNAIKFTPAGGKVSVTLRQHEKWADIEVTDTGIGISKSEQEKIFNRFYQVDSSEARHHEGSGIGLSLARDFAELHHGSLSVKSELNSGTSFLLRLKKGDQHFTEEEKKQKKDVYRLQQAPAFSASNEEEVFGEDKTKILVVEDNADLRAFIREIFIDHYTVIEASNGAEAIKQVSEDFPDLIIADIMMPKMDGIAFNRELKKIPAMASIPLIFLTAKSTRENKIIGLTDGADGYITKPFDPEILKARVQNLIESRFRLRSLLAKERREAASQISKSSADPFLEKVEKVLSVNYTNPDFNVTKLVENLFLDRSQVLRKLKSITGLSPSEYIKKYRMEEASRLLNQKAGTISEVAYAVGFKSLAYFSFAFKEYFEVSPSTYLESES